MDGGFGGEAKVIRIVKKKKGGGGHHGGAWKVAYADFVTAMMAFFLVMWILGLSRPVRQAIASYFNDPSGLMRTSHGGKSPLASGSQPEVTPNPEPIFPTGKGLPHAAMTAEFREVQKAIQKELEKTQEFQDIKESVDIRLTSEGLRIELMEKTASLFFDTGSAALKSRTIHLLRAMAKELGRLNSPMVIEGHTDSQPLYGRNGYSNWELSSDRANAARRAMEGHGLRKGQVFTVRGYADKKLLRPDEPFHFSNRRVSILVAYSLNEEGADEDAAPEKPKIKPTSAAHPGDEGEEATSAKEEGGSKTEEKPSDHKEKPSEHKEEHGGHAEEPAKHEAESSEH